jgi:ubiquinone biosynthesis protein UbiJ
MAQQQRSQDIFSKLADRGEEVIGKLGDMPGAQRLLESANMLKERADELQKRIRGLDALERRVAALERKVDQLSKSSGPKRPAAKRTTKPKPKPT